MVRELGTPSVFSAALIDDTASPSDTPGAVSNEMLAAGNWDTRFTCRGASCCFMVAKAASGVAPPLEPRRYRCFSASGEFRSLGSASRITRYWLASVKMVEMMRWPKAS